jgi:beta-xylosidase
MSPSSTFHLLLISGLLLRIPSSAQTSKEGKATNPIVDGWYADPEVTAFAKEFWLYPTYSARYEKQVFFDAFSSTDLVHWKKHPRILDTAAIKWAKRAMWAPAVVAKDQKYYFFFAANDIQSDAEFGGIGVAIADKPDGPFKDYLGKPLISKFQNGAQPIDQFIFKDNDGSWYIFYGGWKHCNVAKLNNTFTDFIAFEDGSTFKEVTPEGYVEGPFMFKRRGKYYFMWSEGGWGGPDYSVAYAIADSPLGPFTRIAKILEQDPQIATGAGHHSVVQIPGKDEWRIVYHRRPLRETHPDHRVTCMDMLEFDNNGFIKPVKMTK